MLVFAGLALGVDWGIQHTITAQSSVRYEVALTHFEAGDYKDALVILERVLASRPRDLPSLVLAGRAYLRLGYSGKAEQSLRQAQQAGAHPGLVSVPLAGAYLQQGKYQQLIDELPATSRDPGLRAKLLVMHGQAYLALRRFDRARTVFDQAVALLPRDPGALLGRAHVRVRSGKPDEAARVVEEAGAIAPDDAQVRFVRGEVARTRRDAAGAMTAYGETVARDSNNLGARLARAGLLVAADRDQEALADLRAVWAVRPDDPQANYTYAFILTKAGDTEKAREAIERAALSLMGHRTDFTMRHAPSLLLMGVLHFRNDDYDQAFPLLDRYMQIEPNHPGIPAGLRVTGGTEPAGGGSQGRPGSGRDTA